MPVITGGLVYFHATTCFEPSITELAHVFVLVFGRFNLGDS